MGKPAGAQMTEAVQLGEVTQIPTAERHFKQFAFKHSLEIDIDTISDDGKFQTTFRRREIYTVDKKELFGGDISIDVTGIKRALVARQLPFRMFQASLNEGWVNHVLNYGGCEEDHIVRLTPADLRRPGILVLWTGDGSNTTLIDGNHRLVRRWREGLTTFDFAVVSGPTIVREGFVAEPDGAMLTFFRGAERRGEKA
jgi:hypothetical protein